MCGRHTGYLRHLKYIVEKDGKTFLVRPLDYRSPRCEVLEYKRYSPDQIETVSSQLREFIRDDYPEKGCVVATFVLSYLINSDTLIPYRGIDDRNEHHWWLVDETTGRVFDLTDYQYKKSELKELHAYGKRSRLYSYQSKPQKRFFSAIQKFQPSSVVTMMDNPKQVFGNF